MPDRCFVCMNHNIDELPVAPLAAADKNQDQQSSSLFKVVNLSLVDISVFLTPGREALDQVIMIDIRIFLEYRSKHIVTSIHANCAPIMLKRLLKGDDSVVSLVTDKFRPIFKAKFPACPVVIYDGSSSRLDESAAKIYADALAKEGGKVHFLSGGFASFAAKFPELTEADTTKMPSLALSKPIGLCNVVPAPSTPMFIFDGPSKVLDFIYLGNREDSMNRSKLGELGVTHIINVTSDLPNVFESDKSLSYLRIAVDDTFSQRISDHFEAAIKFIEQARIANGVVFVHCAAGISRSTTIVMAYLIKMQKKSVDESFA